MMWGWDCGWGAWGVVMGILMLLFWAAVIVGIVLVVRSLTSNQGPGGTGQPPGGPTSSALQVLEERYARGEIDREEFMRRREDLLSRPGG